MYVGSFIHKFTKVLIPNKNVNDNEKEIIENSTKDSLYKPTIFSSFSRLAKTLPKEYTDTICILEETSDKNRPTD